MKLKHTYKGSHIVRLGNHFVPLEKFSKPSANADYWLSALLLVIFGGFIVYHVFSAILKGTI